MEHKDFRPLKPDDLIAAMEIESEKLEIFFETLREMEREGLVILNKKGRYGLCRHMNLFAGRIEGKGAGYGFFIPDGHIRSDIYITAENLHGALHNDRVLVRVVKEQKFVNGKDEGEVVRILERVNTSLVGVYEEDEGIGFVIPDDKRIGHDVYIPKSVNGNARDGDVVVVAITKWPEGKKELRGKVTEIVGRKNAPGTDMETVIRKYQLPEKFPDRVRENAIGVAKIEAADYKGRRDLRNGVIVTIDGADARDLDDAVSLKVLKNGHFSLGVHIADVGHYVKAGSALDREAYHRGTSVYFPDRVIPMLPQELSNHICSLNPETDRLTLSCAMEIDAKGRVVRYDIFESVICSKERMTYDDVNAILEGDEALSERYAEVKELFFALDALRAVLTAKRQRRGALDFDFPEAKVILNADGEPVEVIKRRHGRAESIIEECMIVANETVAGEYFHRDIPFIYRVHDLPSDDKVMDLKAILAPFGFSLGPKLYDLKPHTFQRLLQKIKGTPAEYLLEVEILRTLSHAVYDTDNRGHFGLASDCYCHFTSPIRRYPDLCIHRVIKDMLHLSALSEEKGEKLLRRLSDAAQESSIKERVAEDAEREAVDIKLAQYMAAHLGEEFPGVISGVTAYGFFVELENTVNGLVHVSSLEDDYYEFHPNTRTLMGTKNRVCFRLGDRVRVKVARVNLDEHLIDFEFLDFFEREKE